MTCNHSYGIILDSSTALKVLCSTYSSLSPPTFLATTDLFTINTVFPFSECHIAGIIQSVVFQVGLFHLVICIKVPVWLFMVSELVSF